MVKDSASEKISIALTSLDGNQAKPPIPAVGDSHYGGKSMTVAQTILDQLGGNKFIAMTGSKNFLGGEKSLSMKLAKNQSGATHLRIELEPTDTYKMEFF